MAGPNTPRIITENSKTTTVCSAEAVHKVSIHLSSTLTLESIDEPTIGGFPPSSHDTSSINPKKFVHPSADDGKYGTNDVKSSDKANLASADGTKTSCSRVSVSSSASDGSVNSSIVGGPSKPHKANDVRWDAIQAICLRDGNLGLSHFRLLKRLGCGDIGSVYLSELNTTNYLFAMKVMDKCSLANRKKLVRAQTEKEILACLDHPFLPTLYAHFETEKFSCLIMEFCPGGDLHTLRQQQAGKHFPELAARYSLFQLKVFCFILF